MAPETQQLKGPVLKDVRVQESADGRVHTDEGARDGFIATQTDAQNDQLTAGRNIRVIRDLAGKEIDVQALVEEATQLQTRQSVLRLVGVSETERDALKSLEHFKNVEIVYAKDTAAALNEESAEETEDADAELVEA